MTNVPATPEVAQQSPSGEQSRTWYFTFGAGQPYDGRYVTIAGTHADAREEMVRRFGLAWCDQYSSREAARIDEFGLRLLAHRDWPPCREPREHRLAAGSRGGPGECSVECACGTTFAGFDTIHEAAKYLGDHIAAMASGGTGDMPPLQPVQPPPGPPTGPTATPADRVSAAAAGQPALVRIARANMLRAISRKCFAVERSALPAPEAVAFVGDSQAVDLEFSTMAQAQAWAVDLGADREAQISENRDATGTLYRGYRTECTWRGFEVTLAAVERAEQLPATAATA